jgi:predicted lipoprotein with Yx(FWY)xxD motif
MSRIRIALVGAVAALAVAALIPAGLAGASSGSRTTVAVAHSKLGRILVNSRGRSLYLFEKDKHRKSTCNGACAANWPPLISAGKPRAGSGVRAALLGRTKRKDGRWQVTYNGHPLYTFVKDHKKGQTNGEGLDFFGGEWYVVSPKGAKVEKEGDSDQTSSGGYGSSNYGQ